MLQGCLQVNSSFPCTARLWLWSIFLWGMIRYCWFFLNRFPECFNLFVPFFFVTICLVVAVQHCMEWIPIKKKSVTTLFSRYLWTWLFFLFSALYPFRNNDLHKFPISSQLFLGNLIIPFRVMLAFVKKPGTFLKTHWKSWKRSKYSNKKYRDLTSHHQWLLSYVINLPNHSNGIRTHNHLVRKRTLKIQVSHLFRAWSSLTFRQL